MSQNSSTFCDIGELEKLNKDIVNTVKSRIYGHGRGWCFTPNHFSDLNSEDAIRTALVRMAQSGFIRRLAQGLYEYPRVHEVLGTLPPQIESVAKAIAEKNNLILQPSGAYAANLIGLTEQVPGKIIFLTNGRTRKLKIGNQEIVFRSVGEKTLSAAGTKVGLVIQALKNFGPKNIDEQMQKRIGNFLQGTSKAELGKNLRHAPSWIRSFIINSLS